MIDTSQLSPDLVKGIASNLGWNKDEDIEPFLAQIAEMTPVRALRCYAAWHLGYGEWAEIFINGIDELREAETK